MFTRTVKSKVCSILCADLTSDTTYTDTVAVPMRIKDDSILSYLTKHHYPSTVRPLKIKEITKKKTLRAISEDAFMKASEVIAEYDYE